MYTTQQIISNAVINNSISYLSDEIVRLAAISNISVCELTAKLIAKQLHSNDCDDCHYCWLGDDGLYEQLDKILYHNQLIKDNEETRK